MIEVQDELAMKEYGQQIGRCLRGGDVIELIGDVGAGKTTLTKGIALGMGIDEPVQSPSFTVCREYQASPELYLVHYDFYRLNEAGIMASDVSENLTASDVVTIIEWAGVVSDILPDDRLTIRLAMAADDRRSLSIEAVGERATQLVQELGW